MTKICCVCNRVEKGEYWMANYAFAPNEKVTHGYCPGCFNRAMAEITAFVSGQQGSIQMIKQKPERRTYIPACV